MYLNTLVDLTYVVRTPSSKGTPNFHRIVKVKFDAVRHCLPKKKKKDRKSNAISLGCGESSITTIGTVGRSLETCKIIYKSFFVISRRAVRLKWRSIGKQFWI